MQVATPAAPVVPSLGGDTQLQQVRATTRLVDSIVGAVTSYKSMEKAFEDRDEQERLKAERKLKEQVLEDSEKALRDLEPEMAKNQTAFRRGDITAEQANKNQREMLVNYFGGEDSKAFLKTLDALRSGRNARRTIQDERNVNARNEELALIQQDQQSALVQNYKTQEMLIQTNPDRFNPEAFNAARAAEINSSLTDLENEARARKVPEDQIKRMIEAQRSSLENVNDAQSLALVHQAKLLENADLLGQAKFAYKAALQGKIAEMAQQDPLPPAGFEAKFDEVADQVETEVFDDPRFSGMNATQQRLAKQAIAEHVLAQRKLLVGQNRTSYENHLKLQAAAESSMAVEDRDENGDYLGTYATGPLKNRENAKEGIRNTYRALLDAGVFGPPRSASSVAAFALTVAPILEKFDEARANERLNGELPVLEEALGGLKKRGDGDFPDLKSDKRRILIDQFQRKIDARKAELAAGLRPFQKAAKAAADDYISDLANGGSENPNFLLNSLQAAQLDKLTIGRYLQEEEYAKWFNFVKAENGGLEGMNRQQLEQFKKLTDPANWEEKTDQPEGDRIFTKDLREKWHSKFSGEIDAVIKQRESDNPGYIQKLLDADKVGTPGVALDPERIAESFSRQKKYDPTKTPKYLPKETIEEFKAWFFGTEAGGVRDAVIGGLTLQGPLNDPVSGKTEFFAEMAKIENEIESSGDPDLANVNLFREFARAVNRPEGELRLWVDFRNASDPRKSGLYLEATAMKPKEFADARGIDLKALREEAVSSPEVLKAMMVTPGSRVAGNNGNARIGELIVNYAMAAKVGGIYGDLDDDELIVAAANEFIQMQGDAFAMSSSQGEGGTYIPVPEGLDVEEVEEVLLDRTYWADAGLGAIREAFKGKEGGDRDAVRTQTLIADSSSFIEWVTVEDGSKFQLFVDMGATPLVIGKEDLEKAIEKRKSYWKELLMPGRIPGRDTGGLSAGSSPISGGVDLEREYIDSLNEEERQKLLDRQLEVYRSMGGNQ